MSALDTLITSHPVPTYRRAAWIIMIAISAAIGWAYVSHLDEVAIAKGEVTPQSRVKVVQHLEGGVIQSIQVLEGARVAAGDVLLHLELAPTAMNREEIQIRLDQLVLSRARFEAEAGNVDPRFPAEESRRHPDMVRNERAAYDARKQEFASTMQGLSEQLRQRELAVRELEVTRRARQADLRLSREKLKISESLLEGNLVSRIEHIQLQRDTERLEGEILILDQTIPRASAAASEGRERIREEQLKFRRNALDEIGKAEANILRTRELLNDASGQKLRTEIRSPIDGVVKNMRYTTIGGVVRSGEPIMEIVPLNDNLVIEARLSPIDRGYVRESQRAVVKVSTYDYVRYGGLEGRVTHIGADVNTDPQQGPYFKVIVETDKSYLGGGPEEFPILSGMQASVDIHTGTRSVMDYLVRPVLKLRHEAFRER